MWVRIKYANIRNLYSCTCIDLTSIYTCKWAFEKSWKNVWLLSSCILSYPNFEVIGQSCTAMPREKPQANFLLCCWTFPEMGSLLNHLRKKHEWARCRHMPARTQEHHCRLLEFTDSKSAKESSVSPSSCAERNSLYTVVLLRSGDYLTRPCLRNCNGQENVEWL